MAITTVSSHVVSVNAIQGTLIADNAITAVHIATNAVSGTLIADNAVTAVHVAQNSITVTQLADDCVESDKIADGVITTNHLNKAMISSQTEVTPVAGDFVLLGDTSDSNNLKKAPLTLLLNSNVDLSTKLNLSGGTMTGVLKINSGDDSLPTLASSTKAVFATDNTANYDASISLISASNNGDSSIFFGDYANEDAGIIQYKNDNGGSDYMAISVNTSEAMRISHNGHVGIGMTSAPVGSDTCLSIYNSATPRIKLHNSTTGTASGDGGEINMSGSDFILENREAGNVRFFNNGAERMRIDSAGTIYQGGVTTPTLHSATTGIVFTNGSLLTDIPRAASRSITLAQNAAVDSGNTFAYLVTDEASAYQQFNGNHYFMTAASGSAGADITFNTRLFVGNTGNVGIGVSDPDALLEVSGSSRFAQENAAWSFDDTGNGRIGFWKKAGLYPYLVSATGTPMLFGVTNTSNITSNVSSSTVSESMRILADRGICMNVTGRNNGAPEVLNIYNAGSGGGYGINIKCIGSSGGTMLRFNTAGNIVGQIYTSSSATTYATSSDYRLKENVSYTWDATARLKQLKPARFNFIADADTTVDGFLAHEVSSIVPEAIKGEKDGEEMQCIDHSKLVPLLVKTIQELEARLDNAGL